jgi:6-phosphofructokinase 1
VEVMGRDCGFLALMGGITTGAEVVYLPEEGISLRRLEQDLESLRAGFALGKRRGLLVRGEGADDVYTTSFVTSLLARESGGLFDVHGAVLGRVQHGGPPSPFDRIQATRLAAVAVDHLIAQAQAGRAEAAMVGLRDGEVAITPLAQLAELSPEGAEHSCPATWWMALRPLADVMASPRGE